VEILKDLLNYGMERVILMVEVVRKAEEIIG
jgi:hypothetical protein